MNNYNVEVVIEERMNNVNDDADDDADNKNDDDDDNSYRMYLSENRFEQRIMLIIHDKIINSFLDSRCEEWSTNK